MGVIVRPPLGDGVMAKEKKSCFIIMPITTPEGMVEKYRDGKKHFEHVLECLFGPSVSRAGYEPVPPKAKGSDLIHAGIIENLETADLVLCDMSCLNPNVFFEFGIRTALNKPVCLVKDEFIGKVPFDTTILNFQDYQSTLEPWDLDKEINKLSEHIAASAKRSKDVNTLWKYFGLKQEAQVYEGETGTEGKLDFLAMQMGAVLQRFDTMEERYTPEPESRTSENWIDVAREFTIDMLPKGGIYGIVGYEDDNERTLKVVLSESLSLSVQRQIRARAWAILKVRVRFEMGSAYRK